MQKMQTRPMSADDFKATLKRLGWTYADATSKLKLSDRTICNYAKLGAPEAVRLALASMEERR